MPLYACLFEYLVLACFSRGNEILVKVTNSARFTLLGQTFDLLETRILIFLKFFLMCQKHSLVNTFYLEGMV